MKHPAHPLIVHFPVACWSLSTFGDIAGLFIQTGMTQAIGFLMLIGCISAVFAMLAGMYEVTKISNINSIVKLVDHHMYAAITAWSFYLLSLYLRWKNGLETAPDPWVVISSIAGFICLALAGWYGANLVYTYGVGTNKSPGYLNDEA